MSRHVCQVVNLSSMHLLVLSFAPGGVVDAHSGVAKGADKKDKDRSKSPPPTKKSGEGGGGRLGVLCVCVPWPLCSMLI
jgi:hypothetical protein